MARERNEHLTPEQLSAFLDRQLSPQELAECDAHVQHCQQCQSLLADLRLTAGLLRGLPPPELPCSFVLSTPIAEERPVRLVTPMLRREGRSRQDYLQRSVRVMSTIAAVVGLFFILSALFTTLLMLPHGATSMATSAPAPSHAASGGSPMRTAEAMAPGFNRPRRTTKRAFYDRAGVTPQAPAPTPVSTGTAAPNTVLSNEGPHQAQPAEPGPTILSLPAVGVILLVLGVLGMVLTRRRKVRI